MGRTKKITIEVPEALLRRAQKVSGEGLTATVRQGLEMLADSVVYDRLLDLKGKVHVQYDIEALRRDRR